MSILLFPRLDRIAAQKRWARIEKRGGRVTPPNEILPDDVTFTQVGGSGRIESERLSIIRNEIVEIATDCGYPLSHNLVTEFDYRCSRYLTERAGVAFPEACRREVWAYFSLVLLPDVADWRFPNRTRERWLGTHRNTFGVVWRRGFLIGMDHNDGRGSDWPVLRSLGQDALVAIVERAGVSANPVIARALAKAASKVSAEQRSGVEKRIREAMIVVRARALPVSLDALEPDEVDKWVFELVSSVGA